MCAALVIAAAFGVSVAERQGLLTSARLVAHNLLAPGRLTILSISSGKEKQSKTFANVSTPSLKELEELQQLLLDNELQRRQLLIENARMSRQLRQETRLSPVASVIDDQLVQFRGRPAAVLNHHGLSDTLKELIVDAGRAAGLRTSELVVSGNGILLDQGSGQGVEAGQDVASGAIVIGRVEQVSGWVSLVRPITDPEFSAAVQIVKRTAHGAAFGAAGMLEGTGESNCRITGIPYTEAVAVGDDVFSSNINGVNGPRLYFGRIVVADYSSGGEWTIIVEPAVRALDLSHVTIVQPRLNPGRVRMLQRQTATEPHHGVSQ